MASTTPRSPRAVEVLSAVYADLLSGALATSTHTSLASFLTKYIALRPKRGPLSQPGQVDHTAPSSTSTTTESSESSSSSSSEASESSDSQTESGPGTPVVGAPKRTRRV